MKTRLAFTLMAVFTLFIAACSDDDDKSEAPIDIINDEFAIEKQEVMETFGEVAQSILDGDMDKLISLHAYSSKFTEFKNGEPRNDGAANEAYERNVFGSVTEV